MPFFQNITELPEVPDLVVIAIPAASVVAEIKKSAEFGVKNFIIYSSGFKEIGPDGEKLEAELIGLADQYQLNILGPNCLGFASPPNSLNVTFGKVVQQSGNLKLISQSGAIAAAFFEFCQSVGLGFDTCLTLGNKTILNENDFLSSWVAAPSPVGLYLESISQGREFTQLISQITPHQPVFILKPGKSSQAAAAMKSHTGSIATPDFVLDAALQQSGVIRCSELGEFFDLAKAVSLSKIPPGPRVAVISNAGGPAVIATDTIISSGLKLADLSADTKAKLSAILPAITSINNPVDLMGDALADRFAQSLEIIIQDPAVDSVLVILTPQLMTQVVQTAQIVDEISQKSSKLILRSFIPTSFPENAIKVLSGLWQWQQWRQNESTPLSVSLPREAVQKVFVESSPSELPQNLLTALSIPTPASAFITTFDEAAAFSQKNNFPVVLKTSSDQIIHKTDVGGVVLDIKTDQELSAAFNQLASLSPTLQIQSQIIGGIEIILGCKRDPVFGPVMLFGAGGKFAELIADRNLALLPLNSRTIEHLVTDSQVSKLLSGFRGDSAYDLDPLYQTMQIIGQLFLDFPQISEIEINPLVLTHQGIFALDPKLILTSRQ